MCYFVFPQVNETTQMSSPWCLLLLLQVQLHSSFAELACSVVLCVFGIAIMPRFVPAKSLAYVVTKITAYFCAQVLGKKKQGRYERRGNSKNLDACNFLWLARVEQK